MPNYRVYWYENGAEKSFEFDADGHQTAYKRLQRLQVTNPGGVAWRMEWWSKFAYGGIGAWRRIR